MIYLQPGRNKESGKVKSGFIILSLCNDRDDVVWFPGKLIKSEKDIYFKGKIYRIIKSFIFIVKFMKRWEKYEKWKNLKIKDYPILQEKVENTKFKKKQTSKSLKAKRTAIYKKNFLEYYWIVTKCMICWSEDRLQIHHKDKNHDNQDPLNLIKLCYKCHCEAHKWDPVYKYMIRWL